MIYEAEWSIPVGILILIIATVLSIVFYVKTKKISIVSYIASISVYAFAIFYLLDVFDLRRNYVLLSLVFSTIIMFLLARYYFNIVNNKDGKENKKIKKQKKSKNIHMILLIVLFLISMFLIVFSTSTSSIKEDLSINENLNLDVNVEVLNNGENKLKYDAQVDIFNLSIENNYFLPQKVDVKKYVLCLNDSSDSYLHVRFETLEDYDFRYRRNLEISSNSKLEFVGQIRFDLNDVNRYFFSDKEFETYNSYSNLELEKLPKSIDFKLYELDYDKSEYNFCRSNKDGGLFIDDIKLNININNIKDINKINEEN